MVVSMHIRTSGDVRTGYSWSGSQQASVRLTEPLRCVPFYGFSSGPGGFFGGAGKGTRTVHGDWKVTWSREGRMKLLVATTLDRPAIDGFV